MKYLLFVIFKYSLFSISLLPFWVLHRFSDFLYVIFCYILKYRKRVIDQNLAYCFPEKSVKERIKIRNQFYRHFCDIVIESIKSFTLSEKEARKRHKILNPERVRKYIDQGKNVVLIGNHYGNWEYYAYSLAQVQEFAHPKAIGVYNKPKNPYLHQLLIENRSRSGIVLINKPEAMQFISDFKEQFMVCLAADQAPRYFHRAYFMRFMNLETAVFYGPEKIAKDYDLPVLYARVNKVKRSHYEITFEEITSEPRNCSYGFITETHMRKLEEDLYSAPQHWLWSHRRWKNLGYPKK